MTTRPTRLTDDDLREALMLDAEASKDWFAEVTPDAWDEEEDEACAYFIPAMLTVSGSDFDCMGKNEATLAVRYRNDYPRAAAELLMLRVGLREIENVSQDDEIRPEKACDLIVKWARNLLAGRAWDDDGEVT